MSTPRRRKKNTEQTDTPKQNVFHVNFSNEFLPAYKETKGAEWVLNGKNHEFVKLLIELQDKSAIHHSITKGKAQMITGEGFSLHPDSQGELSDEEILDVEDYLKSAGFNEALKHASVDYSILGYCFLQLTRSKDRSAIAKVEHVDASLIAVGKKDEDGFINEYWFSNDWSNLRKEENKPEEIPAFDFEDASQDTGLIMIKDYTTGSVYYPKPDYVSAINWIEVDYQISCFHKSSLENGMLPSMWVSFNNGNPTEEEKERIYDEIKEAYGGANNAGKIILTFSNSKDTSPEYTMLNPSDSDKQFLMLSDSVQNQILRAHQANPVLFVQTPGSLGQSHEIRNASELFFNQVINPIQILFEKVFNEILDYSGFEDVRLTIRDSQPISFTFTEENLLQVITKDEARAKIGYEPIQTETTETDEPLLIERIGIGGIQALQSLIADVNLSNAQKVSSLQIIFGLSEEEALQIVGNDNPTPNIQTPKTNVAK